MADPNAGSRTSKLRFELSKKKHRARVHYLEFRGTTDDKESLFRLILKLLEFPAEDFLLTILDNWSQQWDNEAKQERADAIVASKFDANAQLDDLLTMLGNAKTILTAALNEASMDGSSTKIDTVGSALRNYNGLWTKVVEYSEKVQQEHAATVRKPQFETRVKWWERTLKAHYAGRGPQYLMLVRQCAEWQARLDVYSDFAPTQELKEYSRLHLNYLAELKKHTESSKVSSTADIDQIMTEFVKIVEQRLGPSGAPTLRLIIGDVKEKLAG